MKNILPLAILLILAVSCKKENESVHEPVAGLETISSSSQISSEISQGVSLVFFHASWCEVCHAQRPAVSEVATDSDLSAVFFGEVEYDDYPDIITEYGVQGFPTILIFKDGVEVDRLTGGNNTASAMKSIIQSHL